MSISLRAPAEVKGKFETMRSILHPILIFLFLLLPWLQLKGKDLFVLNVIERKFIFFGHQFFSHDVPLLFFLIINLILAIFFLTALWGRLWCGWLCPQSVFIHSVFNKIEKIILGHYSQRIKFFSSGGSLPKEILLYALFIVVSWGIAHSFLAYFVGGRVVIEYIREGPAAHFSTFISLCVATLMLSLNFTFFREKLCFFICPYGRFQNALIDRNSLIVQYDAVRGEPRGALKRGAMLEQGDCVNCGQCVRACPTNIDIRNGFQLECISCAKCIDACDSIMSKLGRATGLIRYETGNRQPISLSRFRLLLYSVLFLIFTAGLIFFFCSDSRWV